MYINQISVNYTKVVEFATANELFSPRNEVYKALQAELVKQLGFVAECNHVFKKEDFRLHFTHSEVDIYTPVSSQLTRYVGNYDDLKGDVRKIVGELLYIFYTKVPADKVGYILETRSFI